MYKICPFCNKPRVYGDRHQFTHTTYSRMFRHSLNNEPRNAIDRFILENIDLSYNQLGILLGVSKQLIGQRVARMGIYKDKNKIPKKYRKVEA